MKVLVCGGGTAGHVEPALNTADALRERHPEAEVLALGTAAGLETRLVPERGYQLELIPAVPLPRTLGLDLLKAPGRLAGTVRQARAIIEDNDIDVVVGFGGYVSTPAYLAARRAKVPFIVHEANAKPGLANRVGARLTPYVAQAVDTNLPHSRTIGIPLRSTITSLDRAAMRQQAREYFSVAPDAQCLLVFGGSLGARSINQATDGALPQLLAAGIEVIHVVGGKNSDQIATGSSESGYHPVEYVSRMDLAYAAADLAVCRAGAMTCAELAVVGLPAVYVPLPHGNGEQRLNAMPTVDANGAVIVPDDQLTPEVLAETVIDLLTDEPGLQRMGQAAAQVGRADAAEVLVDLIEQAAGTPAGSGDHSER